MNGGNNINIDIKNSLEFYAELNKDSDSEDDDCSDESVCLLTNMSIDKNSIKLPCSHIFNLYPLYKEVCQQRLKNGYNSDTQTHRQIKCPYCRTKHNFLLPHIRLNKNMNFVSGVNCPEKLCMNYHSCTYLIKSGKKKNQLCSRTAFYNVNGCYCPTHHTIVSKQIASQTSIKKTNSIDDVNVNPSTCNAILKTGKRVGQECGAKLGDNTTTRCKRHTSSTI
jgi:hypothetical protein